MQFCRPQLTFELGEHDSFNLEHGTSILVTVSEKSDRERLLLPESPSIVTSHNDVILFFRLVMPTNVMPDEKQDDAVCRT
jgi:hypothetical protein